MAYSCITQGNEHSVKMHEALGYKLIGTFHNSGYKNGQWLDTVWLEKLLQPCTPAPQKILGWREVPQAAVKEILQQAGERLKNLLL